MQTTKMMTATHLSQQTLKFKEKRQNNLIDMRVQADDMQ